MGTSCEIQLFAQSYQHARHIANWVIDDIRRLEVKYSRYRGNSLLSRINAIAVTGGSIVLDDETASLLNYAKSCYEQSDGLFDITSGILRRAWRFEQVQLPEPSLIEELLTKVGWHKLCWSSPKLEFPLRGMELDLGGIVKEYAADRAASLCQQVGIQHGVINLGGDIKIIGPRPDSRPWRIQLGRPNPQNFTPSVTVLDHGAVASSGDYERFIAIDGARYSHILNPKTGWPVRHLAAVSVVSEFCVVAGSISTIAMLKEDQGPAWLEKIGLPHLWIDIFDHQGGNLQLS